MSKSPDAFRTISEVADWLGVQAHVLRFWESKFSQVKPVKRAGGRRYYRPADMLLIGGIKKLLHDDGMTIKGVQKMLREQGVAQISSLSQPLDSGAPDVGAEVVDQTVVEFPVRVEPTVEAVSEPEPEPVVAPVEAVSDPLPEPEPEEASAAGEAEPEAVAPVEDLPDAEDEPELVFEAVEEAAEEAAEPEDEAEPPASDLAASAPEAEEPETVAASAPEAEPESADAGTPRLPSFLHRERAAPAEPEEPAESLPKFVHSTRRAAPPPEPREREIELRPGALAHLGAIERLTPEQAARIAPVAAELRAWLDRVAPAQVS